MTIGPGIRLVKVMKITDKQMGRLAKLIIDKLIEQRVLVLKETEEKVRQRALDILKSDFARERSLDIEVNKMLDDLERQNPGSFQRFKMFTLLKKRLAKEKGIVL